jgi:CheY-like chemotaxis protein
VVSDISMPEMDGIELCRKIKKDQRTSHIPIILLTALAGEEQQLKGLEGRRQRLPHQAFQLRNTALPHPQPAFPAGHCPQDL